MGSEIEARIEGIGKKGDPFIRHDDRVYFLKGEEAKDLKEGTLVNVTIPRAKKRYTFKKVHGREYFNSEERQSRFGFIKDFSVLEGEAQTPRELDMTAEPSYREQALGDTLWAMTEVLGIEPNRTRKIDHCILVEPVYTALLKVQEERFEQGTKLLHRAQKLARQAHEQLAGKEYAALPHLIDDAIDVLNGDMWQADVQELAEVERVAAAKNIIYVRDTMTLHRLDENNRSGLGVSHEDLEIIREANNAERYTFAKRMTYRAVQRVREHIKDNDVYVEPEFRLARSLEDDLMKIFNAYTDAEQARETEKGLGDLLTFMRNHAQAFRGAIRPPQYASISIRTYNRGRAWTEINNFNRRAKILSIKRPEDATVLEEGYRRGVELEEQLIGMPADTTRLDIELETL